jgi:hypothetical protein
MKNWKECGRKLSWPSLRYLPGGGEENHKKLSKQQVSVLKSEPGPPKYEAVVLTTLLRCSVKLTRNKTEFSM